MKIFSRILYICCVFVLLTSCRGWRSEKPPVHPNPNLDQQAHYVAQELSRDYPEGVTSWGTQDRFLSESNNMTKSDFAAKQGKTVSGAWLKSIPTNVDLDTLNRGEKVYNIQCAVCHTKVGNGLKSQITNRGWVVPNITQDSTTALSDGELYHIVRYGVRSMPGYAKAISEEDSWAVVAYVRALQKMFRGSYQDVPRTQRQQLRESK